MINTSLVYPVLFLLFPAVNYDIRYSTLSVALLLWTLLQGRFSRTDFSILSLIFLFSISIDLAYSQVSLILDMSRWLIFILFMRFLKLDSLYFFISFLIIANFLFTNPLIDINLDFLHSKNISDLYGRESGLFSSPPVLGYLSAIGILLFIHRILHDRDSFKPLLLNTTLLFMSIYLLIISQNKTLILLSTFLTILMLLRYGKKPISIFLLLFFTLTIPLLFIQLKDEFHFALKLSNFLESGSNSSLTARFDIWGQFVELWLSTLSNFIFGVPNAIQYSIGNTFDNDYLFVVINYGLFGALILLLGFSYILKLMWRNKFSLESFCVGLALFAAFFVGILSSPQSDILFLVTLFSLSSLVRKNNGNF